MKNIFTLFLLPILFFSHQGFSNSFETYAHFASKEKAIELLCKSDEYLINLSPFDIASKFNNSVSKDNITDIFKENAKSWSRDEEIRLKQIIHRVQVQLNQAGYVFEIPDTIYMVRTSGNEEGGSAAYTRQNYIVFGDQFTELTDSILTHLVAHELFHIISRNNPDIRNELYAAIGFSHIKNFSLPADLENNRISNPDATDIAWMIELEHNKTKGNYIIYLYSSKEYNGGSFLQYLKLGFLRYDEDTGVCPEILSFGELTGIFEQCGSNTNYIIHPEEILAENFAFSLNPNFTANSPEIIERMQLEFMMD